MEISSAVARIPWKTNCYLFLVFILLTCFLKCTNSDMRSVYGHNLIGKTISGHTITAFDTDSWVRCFTICLDSPDCVAVSFDYQLLHQKTGVCELKSESSDVVDNPQKCTISLDENITSSSSNAAIETTSVPLTSTEIATVATTGNSQEVILAVVESLQDMCYVGSSYDITVITTSGVYIYNNDDDLSVGPCSGPLTLASVFTGYNTRLPALSEVNAILSYDVNLIEMYAGGSVYKWSASSGQLTKMGGFPKTVGDHLGYINGVSPTSPRWAIYRGRNGKQRFFYDNNDFFMFCEQGCTSQTFGKWQKVWDQNSNNLNVWSSIPTDIASICSLDNQHLSYVIFDTYNNYFTYTLANSPDPVITLTSQGQVKF